MTVEERVREALRAEADRTDVDLVRLHAATRRRAEGPRATRRPRTARAFVVPLGAALVVAALVVGLLLVRLPGGTRAEGPATREARVDTRFTCANRQTDDDADRRRDDALVPSLDDGAAAAARMERAPRYALTRSGDTATLRLGNADGTLASTAEFARSGSGWDLVTTTKCVGADGGILADDPDPLRLGRRDARPYPADRMIGGKAVLVDDRSFYDTAGLVRHRTIWAAPCRRRLCVASGSPDSMVIDDARPGHELSDLGDSFLPPDDLVGKKQPYGFWAVHDPEREATSVRARDGQGRTVGRATRLRGKGWTGQAWFVIAPRDRVADVAVDWVGVGTEPFPVDQP